LTINERLTIIITASLLTALTSLFLARKAPHKWQFLIFSNLLLMGILLLYFYFLVKVPSHGIAILILPLVTVWIIWRQEDSGNPRISPGMLVVYQILFCLIYVFTVWLQEH